MAVVRVLDSISDERQHRDGAGAVQLPIVINRKLVLREMDPLLLHPFLRGSAKDRRGMDHIETPVWCITHCTDRHRP